jgi:LPXTG-site transpeptidase (sortase) family protein
MYVPKGFCAHSRTLLIFMKKGDKKDEDIYTFCVLRMRTLLFLAFAFCAGSFAAIEFSFSATDTRMTSLIPLPPDTSFPSASSTEFIAQPVAEVSALFEKPYPVRLRIPSIRLDTAVENVGLNEKGEMDVPDGKSKNVGWYEYGTVPGETGSAVMDAHVYAAFKNLKYAKIGDDVYVEMSDGRKLHFVVAHSMLYKKDEVPRELLFTWNDDERLNLITCAGRWSRALDTYDHRLIVYTTLVD